MTAIVEDRPWDFSHVLDLVNSLSFKPDSSPPLHHSKDDLALKVDVKDDEPDAVPLALGDFGKLWEYLGSPRIEAPQPSALSVQSPESSEVEASDTFLVADDLSVKKVADSAKLERKLKKQQRREGKEKRKAAAQQARQSSSEERLGDDVSDGSIPDTPSLTKTQRKKANRKARRLKEAAAAEARLAAKIAARAVYESEADCIARKPSSLMASVDAPVTPTNKRYNLRERDASGKAVTANPSDPLLEAVGKIDVATEADVANTPAPKEAIVTHSVPSIPPIALKGPSSPVVNAARQKGYSSDYGAIYGRNARHLTPPAPWTSKGTKQLPLATHPMSDSEVRRTSAQPPKKAISTLKLVPSSVHPPSHAVTKPVSSKPKGPTNQNLVPPKTKAAHTILPLVTGSWEDRHWALLTKLLGDFQDDRKHLLSPMNLTTHNNDPKGIHVFVEASNIFIGFHDQLKRVRGFHPQMQIPHVAMSFDALALLMERRRPVAKRVLAGSTPHLPAFDKVAAVGYECSILEKVYKARQLTERQIYFKEIDRARNRKRAKAPPANNVSALTGGYTSGSGSGSETTAPQYAKAAMIEQGVDEILHLKILESVVDTDEPGTIVLATGDAAQAEYSEGFMAMAHRALKKGWTVELVSWSANISAMYTRKDWMEAWSGRFRIVYLDDYAEELLDM